MREILVLGNKVTDLTTRELLGEVDSIIRQDRREVILNTNVYGILLSQKLPWLKEFRNRTRIVHCDGAGVVLGARLLGYEVGPRVSLNDCFWETIEQCAAQGHSVFLLGATEEVIARTAQILRERQPHLRIAGRHHGYFAKEGADCDAVVGLVNAARPNLLLVGFGMPIQERWVRDNADRLQANVVWVVGGLFDLVSGALPLAPKWLRDHALEWAWLSLHRPRRFLQRYVFGNPQFLARILLERARGRGAAGRRAAAGPDLS